MGECILYWLGRWLKWGGKGVEGICYKVMEDVREFVLYWLVRWWQGKKQLFYG